MRRTILGLFFTVALLSGLPSTVALAVTDNQEAICAQPYVIFCENWEARPLGDFTGLPPTFKQQTGWIVSDLGNGRVPAPSVVGPVGVESGQVFDGIKALQIHAPAGANDGGPAVFNYFAQAAPEIWVRFYVKWSSAYSSTMPLGGQKHGGVQYNCVQFSGGCGQNIYPYNGGFSYFIGYYTLGIVPAQPTPPSSGAICPTSDAYIGQVQTADLCQANPPGHPVAPGDVSFPVPGQWFCLETHHRNNSAPGVSDGLYEGYINGTMVGQFLNINTDVTEASGAVRYFTSLDFDGGTNCYGGAVIDQNGLCQPQNPESTHVDLYRWTDNIVVSTQRVGCLGTPPPSNVPLAPTNLRVSSLWGQFLNIFSTQARLLG